MSGVLLELFERCGARTIRFFVELVEVGCLERSFFGLVTVDVTRLRDNVGMKALWWYCGRGGLGQEMFSRRIFISIICLRCMMKIQLIPRVSNVMLLR